MLAYSDWRHNGIGSRVWVRQWP